MLPENAPGRAITRGPFEEHRPADKRNDNGDSLAHEQVQRMRALLKAREAAAVLAIGTRKLWELTNRGEIPCVRIGRAVRYATQDLSAYIAAHKRGGSQ
jgi:excisionase family DNA binding protein